MTSRDSDVEDIVREFDRRAARGVPTEQLDSLANQIADADTLWSVADRVAPEIPTMGAIYRRALAIGAPIDAAIGFLALAHVFNGNDKAAEALVGKEFPISSDPVLLEAWTALAGGPGERVARIREALTVAPDSRRLWRSLASASLQEEDLDAAREAFLWLAKNETNPVELQRIWKVIGTHGWLPHDRDPH